MIAQFQNSGFRVLDARNRFGDDLKNFVAADKTNNPASYLEPGLVFLTGHGLVMEDKDGNPFHAISTVPTSGGTAQELAISKGKNPQDIAPEDGNLIPTQTGVLNPVKEAMGLPVVAFAASCHSGQLCDDVKKSEVKNLTVVSTVAKDKETIFMDGIEPSSLLLAKLMSNPEEYRKAVPDGGALTVEKFTQFADVHTPFVSSSNDRFDAEFRIKAMKTTDLVTTLDVAPYRSGTITDVPSSDTVVVGKMESNIKQQVRFEGNQAAVLLPGPPSGGVAVDPRIARASVPKAESQMVFPPVETEEAKATPLAIPPAGGDSEPDL